MTLAFLDVSSKKSDGAAHGDLSPLVKVCSLSGQLSSCSAYCDRVSCFIYLQTDAMYLLASSSACHIQESAVLQNMVGFTTSVVSLGGLDWSVFQSMGPGCVKTVVVA